MAAPHFSSIILHTTFRRISQLWDNAHTLELEKCLLYSSSIISQFLDFIHCMVFNFIFLLRDNAHSIPAIQNYLSIGKNAKLITEKKKDQNGDDKPKN